MTATRSARPLHLNILQELCLTPHLQTCCSGAPLLCLTCPVTCQRLATLLTYTQLNVPGSSWQTPPSDTHFGVTSSITRLMGLPWAQAAGGCAGLAHGGADSAAQGGGGAHGGLAHQICAAAICAWCLGCGAVTLGVSHACPANWKVLHACVAREVALIPECQSWGYVAGSPGAFGHLHGQHTLN